MFTLNTVTTEKDPGSDSKIEVWRVPLSGQAKIQVILNSGHRINRTSGRTKTVFILLVLVIVTNGMMYRVINTSTTLVLKVVLYCDIKF